MENRTVNTAPARGAVFIGPVEPLNEMRRILPGSHRPGVVEGKHGPRRLQPRDKPHGGPLGAVIHPVGEQVGQHLGNMHGVARERGFPRLRLQGDSAQGRHRSQRFQNPGRQPPEMTRFAGKGIPAGIPTPAPAATRSASASAGWRLRSSPGFHGIPPGNVPGREPSGPG